MEWMGDAAILISVLTTTAFVIGYVALAPFYRSPIGWSLLASKTWIAGIAWLAFLRTTLEVPGDNKAVQILRLALWAMLPIISISTFLVLLVRGQVKSHRRRVQHQAPGEGAQ